MHLKGHLFHTRHPDLVWPKQIPSEREPADGAHSTPCVDGTHRIVSRLDYLPMLRLMPSPVSEPEEAMASIKGLLELQTLRSHSHLKGAGLGNLWSKTPGTRFAARLEAQ